MRWSRSTWPERPRVPRWRWGKTATRRSSTLCRSSTVDLQPSTLCRKSTGRRQCRRPVLIPVANAVPEQKPAVQQSLFAKSGTVPAQGSDRAFTVGPCGAGRERCLHHCLHGPSEPAAGDRPPAAAAACRCCLPPPPPPPLPPTASCQTVHNSSLASGDPLTTHLPCDVQLGDEDRWTIVSKTFSEHPRAHYLGSLETPEGPPERASSAHERE